MAYIDAAGIVEDRKGWLFRTARGRHNGTTAVPVRQADDLKNWRQLQRGIQALEDTAIFSRIDRSLSDVLCIECDHVGIIPYDFEVRRSMRLESVRSSAFL